MIDLIDKKETTVQQLETWKKDYEIITSVIEGVSIKEDNGGTHAYIMSRIGNNEVLIKDDDYFIPGSMKDFYYELDSQEQFLSRFHRLNARINAKVSFIIKKITENSDNYTVYGSRLEAMYILQQKHFIDTSEENPYRVSRGTVVDCDVLSVGERGVLASVCGVETVIDNEKLSGRFFVDDCQRYFKSGDVLKATVTKVYLSDDQKYVKTIRVSPKAYDNYVMAKNVEKVTLGSVYSGTVRNISEYGKYTVVLDIGVLAQIESRNINTPYLFISDRVAVKVMYINDGYVSGWAMKLEDRGRL